MAVRASGDVGIWHETFRVRAGGIRVHTPAAVVRSRGCREAGAASSKADTAAARIGATAVDEPVVEPY
ncbi:MAG: hypothetical protein ACR2IR_06865 [Acidimicrobiia bacterium]